MTSASGDRDAERRRLQAYVENVGREPRNLPANDPARWQWDYLGRSQADKDHLADLVRDSVRPIQEERLF